MAIAGDLTNAASLFETARDRPGSSPPSRLPERFAARFIERSEDLSPETGDELADSIVVLFREYWTATLTGLQAPEEGLVLLKSSLRRLIDQTGRVAQPANEEGSAVDGPEPDDDVFASMGAVLERRGFHYLETNAPPLHDLFLWRKEVHRNYTVRLTDRSLPVRVTFMEGMYSRGWKDFATFGLSATTGWVEGSRLYCVSQAYDRSSERFLVSYLKHETRHLADYQRFPGLASVELEYRAKLTELAFASTTLPLLLEDFSRQGAPNPGSPHAFANYRVTRDLYQVLHGSALNQTGNWWLNASIDAVNHSARELLLTHTRAMETQNE